MTNFGLGHYEYLRDLTAQEIYDLAVQRAKQILRRPTASLYCLEDYSWKERQSGEATTANALAQLMRSGVNWRFDLRSTMTATVEIRREEDTLLFDGELVERSIELERNFIPEVRWRSPSEMASDWYGQQFQRLWGVEVRRPQALYSMTIKASEDIGCQSAKICRYYSDSVYLRCAVHPTKKSCEGCGDFEEGQS